MILVPRSCKWLAALALIASAAPGPAQTTRPGPPSAADPVEVTGAVTPPYAAVADLVLASTVIVDATVRSATRIKGAEAASVPPGLARLYVEADVTALVRGTRDGVPPRVGYLLDIAPDSRGRLPKLRKQRVLLFARAVPGTPGQLQLVTPAAQLAWSAATDALTRRIATDVLSADAPPAITGVGHAFHVAGSLPGEGETQVFLTTADNRPVSLSILRRPGEQPRWAVALSEIVDDAAGPPARDTLLWYRLACSLPAQLPEASTAGTELADAELARTDYRFVIDQLGRCERTPTPAG